MAFDELRRLSKRRGSPNCGRAAMRRRVAGLEYTKYLGEKGLWKAAFGKLNALPKDQEEGVRRGSQPGEEIANA